MRSRSESLPGSRDRLLRWAARLLIVTGAVLLAWCAVTVGDMMLAQHRARRALVLPAVAAPRLPSTPSAPPVLATAVVRGSPLAALSIPRIDLSAVVLHGSDADTLRRAPGHVEHTALPGEAGNVVIAGHRDTFFWPLRHIRPGDDIFLETTAGRLHYRVAWTRVVGPTAREVMAPTRTPALTLITCYPFWTIGPAPDRFIVRATAVAAPAPAPAPTDEVRVSGSRNDEGVATTVVRRPVSRQGTGQGQSEKGPRVVVPGDHSVIREAVERFRAAYNVRRPPHQGDEAAPLVFRACEVAITDEGAAASCVSSNAPDVWSFTLERDGGAWAIRSVEVQ